MRYEKPTLQEILANICLVLLTTILCLLLIAAILLTEQEVINVWESIWGSGSPETTY